MAKGLVLALSLNPLLQNFLFGEEQLSTSAIKAKITGELQCSSARKQVLAAIKPERLMLMQM